MELTYCFIGIIFCLFLQAYFAGAEMGIVSLNRIRFRHRVEEGDKRAEMILQLIENPDKLLGTTLVSLNLALIAASSLTSYLLTGLGFPKPDLLSTAIILPIAVIFAELIPKVIFRRNADRLALVTIYGLRVFYYLLFPIVALCGSVGHRLASLVGASGEEQSPYVTREELRLIIRERAAKAGPSRKQFEMAHQTFYFGETLAKNVMMPLISVKAVPAEATMEEVREFVKETGYSHIPVYEERIDNIVGVMEVIDLLYADETNTARDLMVESVIAPEIISVGQLLKLLREQRAQMAVLIDEYGGVSGIATNEDIMEEIVGEIRDEYDHEERSEIEKEDRALIVDGKVPIDKLNEDYSLAIPKEGIETIAGFVISLFGMIPTVGQKIVHKKLEFEVLESTPRMVQRIRIRKL